MAQTTNHHRWLIYFDPESPSWLRDSIEPYVADGLFKPLYRTEVPRPELLADLRSVAPATSYGIITTNLDNDDALATDFMERVQCAANPGSRHAIFIVNGLIKGPAGVYRRRDRDNAFCSVAEPWKDAQTCWSDWHNRLRFNMPVVELGGAPGWLQVVHGENVSNRIRGLLVSPETWATRFPGLLDDVVPPRRAQLAIDRTLSGPLRHLRDAMRSGARRTAVLLLGKDGLQTLKERVRR